MPNIENSSLQIKLQELSGNLSERGENVPHIEESVKIIDGAIQLFDEMNGSLLQSALQIPSAVSQLSDVTQTTETASNEILGVVTDGLKNCSKIQKSAEASKAEILKYQAVQSVENNGVSGEEEEDLQKTVSDLQEKNEQLGKQMLTKVEDQLSEVAELKKRLNQITMSLQFQDITTQQIASVTHVISTLGTQLTEFLDKLGVDTAQSDEAELESGYDFDAQARYDREQSSSQQADADELIDQLFAAAGNNEEPASAQDEADALFDQMFTREEEVKEPASFPEEAHAEQPGSENPSIIEAVAASREDIDRFFES